MAAARLRGGDRETQVVSRDDAYIYMLVISLVALLLGCVFLFLDYDPYPTAKPQAPNIKPYERQPVAAPQGQPAVAPGGAPGAPAGGPAPAPNP